MSALPSGLILDRYHIDSAYVSWRSDLNAVATFDLYTRRNPFDCGYMVVAGLERALRFIADFRFTDDDLAYLEQMGGYDEAFLDALRAHRFTGEVLAMPEGTVAFAPAPLLRITAPFREALLLEAGLLQAVGTATLIATKAARVVQAARGRPVAEFALRRSHEPLVVARSAWIGGCASTSFVAAAQALGIPASGTVPHALLEAFETEEEAFRAVAETLPNYTLLLDTYDTRRAIHTAVGVARDIGARLGHTMVAVRLDSGDIAADARYCREVLDEAGFADTRIIASGELDEFRIEALLDAGAPIDAFGVGGSIGVAAGSPEHDIPGGTLGTAYKLAWYEGGADPAVLKHAGEKSTWPGRKQVWRIGTFERDLIAAEDEPPSPGSTALLEPVIVGGEVQAPRPSLDDARARAAEQLGRLPDRYKRLLDADPYPVTYSVALEQLRQRALQRHGLA